MKWNNMLINIKEGDNGFQEGKIRDKFSNFC